MTLPLIMMTFSQLSIIAIVANLLVVPLVPVAMLFAAIAGSAGALIPQLAGWFALPANLMLTYILDIIHMLSSIPSVLLHLSISPTLMLSFYCLLLLTVLTMRHHAKIKPDQLETMLIK